MNSQHSYSQTRNVGRAGNRLGCCVVQRCPLPRQVEIALTTVGSTTRLHQLASFDQPLAEFLPAFFLGWFLRRFVHLCSFRLSTTGSSRSSRSCARAFRSSRDSRDDNGSWCRQNYGQDVPPIRIRITKCGLI